MKEENFKNCKKATYLIEKRQFTSLSLWDQIWLKIHLTSCEFCTLFSKQSLVINALIRQSIIKWENEQGVLDFASKQKIQDSLNKALDRG